MPRIRAIGMPITGRPGFARGDRPGGADRGPIRRPRVVASAPRRPRPATRRTRPPPTTIVVSDQNASGKELDEAEPSGDRSCTSRPGRTDDGRPRRPRRRRRRPRPRRRRGPPRGRRASPHGSQEPPCVVQRPRTGARSSQARGWRGRHPGDDVEPGEDRPDITHVRPLRGLEHGRAGQPRRRSRAGRRRGRRGCCRSRPAGRRAEAGPRCGRAIDPARTPTQAGVRNGRIGEGQDHDRRSHADEDRGETGNRRASAHGTADHARSAGWTTTRPRACAPGPTSSRGSGRSACRGSIPAPPRPIRVRNSSRLTARMSRRPSNPDWLRRTWSVGPNPARLSMSASSRQVRTSFVAGVDLVGERLAAGARLAHLEQHSRGEDALAIEAIEVDGLDAGQLGDRRHGASIPPWRVARCPDDATDDRPPVDLAEDGRLAPQELPGAGHVAVLRADLPERHADREAAMEARVGQEDLAGPVDGVNEASFSASSRTSRASVVSPGRPRRRIAEADRGKRHRGESLEVGIGVDPVGQRRGHARCDGEFADGVPRARTNAGSPTASGPGSDARAAACTRSRHAPRRHDRAFGDTRARG